MKWFFLNEKTLQKLGITDFSKFEESEPLAVWTKNDIENTISFYLDGEGIEATEDIVKNIYLKLKEKTDEIFDFSDVNTRIEQEIESIYKEFYIGRLTNIEE